MRPVLRLLGTRYGLALLLAVIVLAVVGVTQAVTGGGGPDDRLLGPAVEVSRGTGPSAADDGLTTPESPAGPVTSPGAASPEKVATDFATAWLRHQGVSAEQWRTGLTRYATPALLEKLKGADPAGVPAQRITGAVTLQPHDPAFVEALIPVDSGRLRLRLLATAGRWLVDGVDWERA